ncbi:hypothetical protein Hanom_Chr09g00802321 [Helianthus anomalus]
MKRTSKKKTATAGGTAIKKTVVTGATSDARSQKGITRFRQSILEALVLVADSLDDLPVIGVKPQGGMTATTRGSGRAGSKGPDSGVTLFLIMKKKSKLTLKLKSLSGRTL